MLPCGRGCIRHRRRSLDSSHRRVEAVQFSDGSEGLPTVVVVLLIVLGAVVAEHIWSGMENKGCAQIVMSASSMHL